MSEGITRDEIKRLLPQMLPDKLFWDGCRLRWTPETCVAEAELLYVCHLAEQTLDKAQCYQYANVLGKALGQWRPSDGAKNWPFHADWETRTLCLVEVKGIQI